MLTVVVLFIMIVALLSYLDMRKPKNFPPGPFWLPVFGSILHIAKSHRKLKYFTHLCAKLGTEYDTPIIGLKFGKDLVVVVNSPKTLKEFLSSDDLIGRPDGEFYRSRTWGERLGVLLTDSDLWKEQRRFSLRHLRDFGFGRRDMSVMIEEETVNMVDFLKKQIHLNNNKVLECDMENIFNIHVLNTLWTMLAGIRYNNDDEELKYLQQVLSELFERAHMFGALFSHFPILRIVAPEYSGYNTYLKAHLPIWNFLNKELQKHKQTISSFEARDFMDVYLQTLNTEDEPTNFTEKQLVAICMDMFMAGSETTSKTLSFGFQYLLLYPDVQRKAQEEIDRIVGRNRRPTLNDRPRMPYIEAVALESLRMFIARAFGVPHRSVRDTTLAGYFIPKDTMVVPNFYDSFMGKDFPDPDPEVFRPERYLKDEENTVTIPDYFIPFGFGKRRCMGETLARANIFLFTATLLQNFNFSTSPSSPPNLEWKEGITPGPSPYKATITLRT